MRPLEWVSNKLDDWRRSVPWGSDEHRERSIIKMVSPIYARANRPMTIEAIKKYMDETTGLSTLETGRKLHALVSAEFPDTTEH